MIRLHYHPGNASFTPHVLLHEIGVPFELVFVDRDHGAHRQPGYLELNPNGQIPVLHDGALVLYETAAISLHLADNHPAAGLAPSPCTPERATYYQWMAWLTNTLQAMLMHYFYPERLVDDGDAAGQVRAHAQRRVGDMLRILDGQLATHGGPWLLGGTYRAVDPYAFMLCRWTRGFDSQPARDFPRLGPYLQRLLQRPAVQRTITAEGLAEPWV